MWACRPPRRSGRSTVPPGADSSQGSAVANATVRSPPPPKSPPPPPAAERRRRSATAAEAAAAPVPAEAAAAAEEQPAEQRGRPGRRPAAIPPSTGCRGRRRRRTRRRTRRRSRRARRSRPRRRSRRRTTARRRPARRSSADCARSSAWCASRSAADRVVAALVDGDVEVPLRLGQPGAGLGADGARGGCAMKSAGRGDRRPGGEHRLVQRRGRRGGRCVWASRATDSACSSAMSASSSCRRAASGSAGEPSAGPQRRVGGGQRRLGPGDLRAQAAAVPARDQRPRLGEVLLGLRPHGGHPRSAAASRSVGEPGDGVEQRGGLRDGVLGARGCRRRRSPGRPAASASPRLVGPPARAGGEPRAGLAHVLAPPAPPPPARTGRCSVRQPLLLLRACRAAAARRSAARAPRGPAGAVRSCSRRPSKASACASQPRVGGVGELQDLAEHLPLVVGSSSGISSSSCCRRVNARVSSSRDVRQRLGRSRRRPPRRSAGARSRGSSLRRASSASSSVEQRALAR